MENNVMNYPEKITIVFAILADRYDNVNNGKQDVINFLADLKHF